jgi:hypothetical protein
VAEVSGTAGIPDVAPDVRGITGVDASPNAFGGLIAQGEQKLAEGAQKGLDFYGQVAADNATNNWHDKANKILYGDPSKTVTGPDGTPQPDTGFFGLRGADAMAARPQVAAELDEAAKEARGSLFTPESQLQFDQDTRRSRFYMDQQTSQHADQQQQNWMISTNETKAALKLNTLGANPLDPAVKADAINGVREAYVRTAAAKGENPQAAVLRADQDVALTQIRSLVVNNPQSAQRVLNANAGVLASRPDYDQITRQVQSAVDEATIAPMIDRAVASAHQTSLYSTSQGVYTPTQIGDALSGTEWHGSGPAPPSVQGAVGNNQIEPSTFKLFARPGEDINNPADNLAVRDRMVARYEQQFGNDPARIAVAYFSGTRNVAPPGSPTPYIRNTHDATGTTVQQYVAKMQSKLGAPQTYPTPADYIRSNEASILDATRSQAEAQFPGRPQEVDRVVQGVQRGLEQTITQQNQQYEVATHVISQVMASDHPPISEQELLSNPTTATAWRTMQIYNLYGAMAVNRMFDANARGRAATYGVQFKDYLDRVLAPAGSPDKIAGTADLWHYVGSGADAPLTNTGANALSDILSARGTPRGEAFAAQTKQFVDTMYGNLTFTNKATGVFDQNGERRYERFMIQALPILQKAAQAGTMDQVLNPKSKDYLGNLAQTFMRSDTEVMHDRLADQLPPIDYNVMQHHLNSLATDDLRKRAIQDAFAHGKISYPDAMRVSIDRGYAALPVAPAAAGPQVPLPSP